MAVLTPRRYLTPLIHVLVWGLFGLTFLLFQPLTGRLTMPPQFWLKQGLMFCVWVSTFYFTGKVLVPRLLFPGRTGWFILALFGLTVAILGFSKFLESALNLPALMDKAFIAVAGRPRLTPRGLRFDSMGLLTTMFVLGISTCITVVQKWQKDAQLRQTLEQQRVSSELSMLKAQINPHFFFNTLNNIYALTLLDGEQARTAIHRLSRMMRYVLYDTAGGMTLLSQEIAFVQDYITLMQLRLDDRVTVTFERPEPVRDVPVAPMLLLPFLENAFKHGVAATEASRIYVAIRQPQPDVVELEVRNSRLALPSTDLAGSNGIGLANTRRRLDLLYPGRFQLVVDDHTPANEFLVHLTLQVGEEGLRVGGQELNHAASPQLA
ncbi:sensor histidine kinase [Hymenobacter monticola]|uniref:Sensor histidine kinase n=1 Tax=Hymenobacter monticola TaxID=1705399 RepID=A0ABY4B0G3_9BACT|nr:sensor histidine kinase [Hymenobacter monticola]UOE32460.1 sensor histidine kinase [Hymenobacter monticola]